MAIFSLWDKENQNQGIKNTEELRKQETVNTQDDNRRSRVMRENTPEIPVVPVYDKLPGTKEIDGKVYESISPEILKSSSINAQQFAADKIAIDNLLERVELDQNVVDVYKWATDYDQNPSAINVVDNKKETSKPGFLNSLKSAYQNFKSKYFRRPVNA